MLGLNCSQITERQSDAFFAKVGEVDRGDTFLAVAR
jgi:hypothetical protein